MSSLSNRLDSFAEAWKPKPGDTLIGVVIGLDKRTSTYNPSEPYAIVSIQVEDGSTEDGGTAIPVGEDRAWHGFDTVVRNELRKLRPRIGQRLGARYHGLHETRGYKRWRIVIESDGNSPAFDWDEVTGDEGSAEQANEPGKSDEDDIPY